MAQFLPCLIAVRSDAGLYGEIDVLVTVGQSLPDG